MKRSYLNWRPGLDAGNSIDNIRSYDPWEAFPGKDILTVADAGALEAVYGTVSDPYHRKEVGILLAIVKAGGYVRKMEQARGVDDVQGG